MDKPLEDKPDAAPTAAAASPANPPDAIKIDTAAAPGDLPHVDAPKLDGSEPIGEISSETISVPPLKNATSSSNGFSRLARLAASIAVVAAVGSFAGALAAWGVVRLLSDSPAPVTADARAASPFAAEIAALKANVDTAARNANTQFAKIAERIDRAERAQTDPSSKISRISDAIDRLEKRIASTAPETTGSISAPTPPVPIEPKMADRVLDGWVVHEVVDGHALIESRYGGLYDIAAGGFLPGVGRVQQIKRQDGHWLVMTARGVIQSYH